VIRHVAVIVPAADEEQRIAACLRALARAAARLTAARPGVTVEVVVVLDGCRDDTAAIVASHPEVRAVVTDARCVGAARALGTAAATDLPLPPDEIWTAHTDADSEVPGDWLTAMVAAGDAGVDLVLGTVQPSDELPPPTRLAWDDLHRLVDDHPHIHGANLGIRAVALQRLGGWRPLASGEDADLVARAGAAGIPTRRTGAIPVRTSARADGRAPEGFSSYLRTLAGQVSVGGPRRRPVTQ
jgi:cellulose synthase/poly-beta-1,6-N-acetylglucosamine synthase-like glycosyltransferase